MWRWKSTVPGNRKALWLASYVPHGSGARNEETPRPGRRRDSSWFQDPAPEPGPSDLQLIQPWGRPETPAIASSTRVYTPRQWGLVQAR
ncbi:unnamed protein product [Caretta caretta]